LNPPSDRLTIEEKRSLVRTLLQKRVESDHYRLSYGQRALWFLHRFAPGSASYNVAIPARAVPALDISRLLRALNDVVARHDPLHAVVCGDPSDPRQGPAAAPPTINVCDARDISPSELRVAIEADYRRPFALDADPPVRVSVYRCAGHDVILLNLHHIACDARSVQLLFEDLRAAYEGSPLPPLTVGYRDFVSWQRDMVAGPQGQVLERYWSTALAGELPTLRLRSARVRPDRPSHTGGSVPLPIRPDLLETLRPFARRNETTLFSVVLLAWSTLLARESGQAEVIVGTPVSGRTRREWDSLIGCFVNTLPLRVRVDIRQSYASQLTAVTETVRQALEHQDYPFSLMVQRLRVHRDAGYAPLFQTMLNVQRVHPVPGVGSLFDVGGAASVPFGDCRLESFPITQQVGQFDWVLELGEFEESLQGSLKYSDDAGTVEDALRLARLFPSVLLEIIRNDDEREDLAL
jgi:hypothetical protein